MGLVVVRSLTMVWFSWDLTLKSLFSEHQSRILDESLSNSAVSHSGACNLQDVESFVKHCAKQFINVNIDNISGAKLLP